MKNFEEKHPYFWLILGLILTMFSYGIFNTGICAWIFAIPLINRPLRRHGQGHLLQGRRLGGQGRGAGRDRVSPVFS